MFLWGLVFDSHCINSRTVVCVLCEPDAHTVHTVRLPVASPAMRDLMAFLVVVVSIHFDHTSMTKTLAWTNFQLCPSSPLSPLQPRPHLLTLYTAATGCEWSVTKSCSGSWLITIILPCTYAFYANMKSAVSGCGSTVGLWPDRSDRFGQW